MEDSGDHKKTITITGVKDDFSCVINTGSTCSEISFNNNGGSGGLAGKKVYYKYGRGWYTDDRCTTPATAALGTSKPTKAGYNYVTYNYKDADSTKTIVTNTLMVNNEIGIFDSEIETGTTAYAKWDPYKYQIAYNCNNGNGTMANSEHVYGTAKNLTENACTRPGYDYQGWATSASSTTVAYTNKASVNILPDSDGAIITLYAVWKQHIYNITLNKGGGSGGTNNIYEKYNVGWYSNSGATTSITHVPTAPTKSGNKFTGYFDGDTRIIKSDRKIDVANTYYTEDKTLTAKWCTTCSTSISNGSCSENPQTDGTCTYTTKCNSGYELMHGDGTTDPKCCQSCVSPVSNGSCELKWADNKCTYTTSCNTGYTLVSGDKTRDPKCCANCGTVTSGTCKVVWESNKCVYKTTCAKGYYLPKSSQSCSQCTAGKYCPGGEYTYNTSKDQGINDCPSGYAHSAAGSDENTDCYMSVAKGYYVKNKKDASAKNVQLDIIKIKKKLYTITKRILVSNVLVVS